jgi:hypothetical protein
VSMSAIGSGGAFAFGSLFSTPGMSPIERVDLAVHSAIEFSPGCRGPVDIIHS